MKKSKPRLLLGLLAVVMCMSCFSVTAFASGGDYYASDENGQATPPDYIEDITVSKEDVVLPEQTDQPALTPDGNLTLIDDILQSGNFASVEASEKVSNKQFITVQSKNGNYFYLVIDRSGDKENVYFMNLVDEADLMSLMEEAEGTATIDVCSCTEKCAAGTVNTACPICKVNMTECVGKEKEPEKPDEPVVEPTEEPAEKGSPVGGIIVLLLIAGVGGGAAYYFFKVKKNKPQTKGNNDLDEYDFGAEDEEYPFEQYEGENAPAEDRE